MSGRILNSRLILAAAALAVLAVGSTIAADRSSSAMASAATKFLDSLTPDQRQEATFAFNADERLPGARRFYSFDPAGNRVEFLARS